LAVITGGSRGIGHGIAKNLVQKHDILILSRTEPITDSVEELKSVRPEAKIEYVVGLDCVETQKVCLSFFAQLA
jgi:NAD(P)-dependent dehydrogenase (short-subunit alcohol dehydrogenase family)